MQITKVKSVTALTVILIMKDFLKSQAITYTVKVILSRKWCKIESLLLWTTNRKWCPYYGRPME